MASTVGADAVHDVRPKFGPAAQQRLLEFTKSVEGVMRQQSVHERNAMFHDLNEIVSRYGKKLSLKRAMPKTSDLYKSKRQCTLHDHNFLDRNSTQSVSNPLENLTIGQDSSESRMPSVVQVRSSSTTGKVSSQHSVGSSAGSIEVCGQSSKQDVSSADSANAASK